MADLVVPHLASQVRAGVDVVFLDTGYHFAETIGTRDAAAATLPVTVRTITPDQTVAEQDGEFGARLYERNPDQCCAMRKVAPLRATLDGYTAWASGLRRDEGVGAREHPRRRVGRPAVDGQAQPDRRVERRTTSTPTSSTTACS